MAFDIDAVIDEMVAAVAGEVSEGWEAAKGCVKSAFEAEKQALADIAKERIAGNIDDKEAEQQLQFEAQALEAALLVCQVKVKKTAQDAVNAAIKVLNDAIGNALDVVI